MRLISNISEEKINNCNNVVNPHTLIWASNQDWTLYLQSWGETLRLWVSPPTAPPCGLLNSLHRYRIFQMQTTGGLTSLVSLQCFIVVFLFPSLPPSPHWQRHTGSGCGACIKALSHLYKGPSSIIHTAGLSLWLMDAPVHTVEGRKEEKEEQDF